MNAGAIPIRWGKTTEDYLPKNCFIAKEDFKSYQDLYTFIKNMPEETYFQYLENIKRYHESNLPLVFSCEYFAHTIIIAVLPGYNKEKAFTKDQLTILSRLITF